MKKFYDGLRFFEEVGAAVLTISAPGVSGAVYAPNPTPHARACPRQPFRVHAHAPSVVHAAPFSFFCAMISTDICVASAAGTLLLHELNNLEVPAGLFFEVVKLFYVSRCTMLF